MTADNPASSDRQRWGMVLKRAEQNLLRAKSAVLKPVGLTLAQYVALSELKSQPGITGATLARACLVTPQAMMVVLNAMHDQGFVERRPNPRHANVLELYPTDVGCEALHAARQLVEPFERRLDDALPPTDAAVLIELLTRIIDHTEPT